MQNGEFDQIKTSDGHVFVIGHAPAADFGDGFTLDTPAAFLIKLDESGHTDWLRRSSGSAKALALGPEGEIAVILTFQGDLEFEGAIIGQTPTPTDLAYVVVRLDGHGHVKSVSDLYRDPTSVAFDPTGELLTVSGGRIIRCGRHGQVLWERSLAEPLDQDAFIRPNSVRTDPRGNLVVTAEYNGPFAIAGDPLSFDPWGSLLAEFDVHGDPVWHRSALGAGKFSDAAADSSADVVAVGRSYGRVDLGTGTLGADGVWTLFLAKYTHRGLPIFAKSWEARSWQVADRLDIDKHGNIGVVAFVDSTVDLGGGPLPLNGVGVSGEASQLAVVIAQFAPDGQHIWSTLLDDGFGQAGGSVSSIPPGVAFNERGELWVASAFWQNAQVGARHLVASPTYGADGVLLKFRQ
jgi:hypothetical protein